MDTPGIEVRPIKDMTTNRHFCEVFFTDVRVPAINLVGAEGGAFKQTMRQLEHERGGIDRLVSNQALYLMAKRAGRHVANPVIRQEIAAARDPATASAASSSIREVLRQAPAGFSGCHQVLLHGARGPRVRLRGSRVFGAEATLWERRHPRPRCTRPATRSWAAPRT